MIKTDRNFIYSLEQSWANFKDKEIEAQRYPVDYKLRHLLLIM